MKLDSLDTFEAKLDRIEALLLGKQPPVECNNTDPKLLVFEESTSCTVISPPISLVTSSTPWISTTKEDFNNSINKKFSKVPEGQNSTKEDELVAQEHMKEIVVIQIGQA